MSNALLPPTVHRTTRTQRCPIGQWPEHSYGLAGERFVMRQPWGHHSHPDLELNLALSGAITYIHAGREQRIEAGRLVAFWAGLPHGVIAVDDGPVDFCWLTVPLDSLLVWGVQRVPELLRGAMIYDHHDVELDRRQIPAWIGELNAGGEDRRVAALEVQARVRRLLGSAQGKAPEPANLVVRIVDWLGANYAEPIRVADAAAAVDCHPQQAMRQFKQATGMTIHAWLTALRVAVAARLLQTTHLPLADVAFQAGFGSRSRFYAAFDAAHGCSPAAWRALYRT